MKRDDEDEVLSWVKKVKDQARKIDEIAHSMHPSAWPEALKDDMERFKILGPQQHELGRRRQLRQAGRVPAGAGRLSRRLGQRRDGSR